MKNKSVCFFVLFFLCFSVTTKAQTNKWAVTGGYGIYEEFSVGLSRYVLPNNELSASIGHNLFLNNQKLLSFKLEDKYLIKTESKILNNTFINVKGIYWILNDNYFEWQTLSAILGVGKKVYINKNSALSVDIGAVMNFHIKHTRKNFEETGWPRQYNMNASIVYYRYF